MVKRIRVGEQVTLTDGAGTSATCTVTATAKSSLSATVDAVASTEPEMPRVVVVQAIPKGDRGELAVEMLTEVGVDVIVPWAASRSRVGVARRQAGQGAGQVALDGPRGRQAVPPLVVPRGRRRGRAPSEVVDLLRDASVPVVLHEAASGPLADLPLPGRGEIVIVVGPEGGISDEELAAFAAVGRRAGPDGHLGPAHLDGRRRRDRRAARPHPLAVAAQAFGPRASIACMSSR